VKRLREWKVHAWIALVARAYLGVIFVWACWHKIVEPQSFALDVATYQIVPLQVINFFALVLPWIELGAGLLLILGVRVRAAALLVSGMMAMFLVALTVALARGLQLSCGCFASQGAAEDPISWRTLLRDGAWLALALYVLAFDERPLGLELLLRGRRR
jgi:uncharacterized membrane protein YphA (DoxX/SURF4 family)